jgi:hypothetical protein
VVEQLAVDFLQAVADRDAEAYNSLQHPMDRQTEEFTKDALSRVIHDTQGCDVNGGDYAVGESTTGIDVYVAFNPPCGSGGVTGACEVHIARIDSEWWIRAWKCS